MTKERTPIPPDTKNEVLMRNRHRCCICHQEQVQIHHINGDPSDHDPKNLAVLCLHHHGLAHAQFKLGQNYTQEVIQRYKEEWETSVSEGKALPASTIDPTAASLSRTYERQQAALRIVIAEELAANYAVAQYRYNSVGGKNAGKEMLTVTGHHTLRDFRWQNLSDLVVADN